MPASIKVGPSIKVALVGPLPPPAGGMANQAQALSNALSEGGVDIRFVQSNAGAWPSFIESIPILRAAFRLPSYLARLWRAAGEAKVLHVMANSGWAWHLHAAPAIWIGWMRGVPVVVNYHGGEAARFFK